MKASENNTALSPVKRVVFRVIMVLMVLLAVFLAGEIIVRLSLKSMLLDERDLAYQYDSELGWFPVPDSERYFQGSRRIFVRHNSRGFRDREHGEKTRPRIMFIGDSFVWGYDVERDERFTDIVQSGLPDWDVVNLGVSGYGTDQEYLLLKREIDHYDPDIVFLVYHKSDRDDTCSNMRYGGYYKPYFVLEDGELCLKGVPVNKSANYYFAEFPWLFMGSDLLRVLFKSSFVARKMSSLELDDPTKPILLAMKNLIEEKGAVFIVGFEHKNEQLMSFCRENGINTVYILTDERYPDQRYGFHWNVKGNRDVAEMVLDYLEAEGFAGKRERNAPEPGNKQETALDSEENR